MARVDPQLKPNHPNVSIKVPSRINIGFVILYSLNLFPNRSLRGPSIFAATRAAIPPDIWTTDDPAKSRAPKLFNHPLWYHIQCAGST